jgi:hypothetical protein
VNAEVQDERQSTAETVTKDSSNVAPTAPHVVSSPGVSAAESADTGRSLNHPSEQTNAASSDPVITEDMHNNVPAETTHASPQMPVAEPAVLENSSPVVVAHAPPPSEQQGSSQDGAEHPQAEGTSVEAATPHSSSQADPVSSEVTPHTEEIPMNESGQ